MPTLIRKSPLEGLLERVDYSSERNDLRRLRIAERAIFDPYDLELDEKYFPGELLRQIEEWAESPDAKCIFWLNGSAGSGKSTIARRVARSLESKKLLGATFFFSSNVLSGNRFEAGRLFPTITRQLVTRTSIPQLLPGVRKAIQDDPDISNKSLKEQFDKLFLQPLLDLEQSNHRILTRVIVIDALDECEPYDDIRLILQLLPQVQKLSSVHLRIFLTSRPELPIHLGFKDIKGHPDLVLREVPKLATERDIYLFLNHKFSEIRRGHLLPAAWPGEDNIQTLVAMLVPSSNLAAIVCQLVGENPGCLAAILQGQACKELSDDPSYALYLQAMEEKDQMHGEFRDVLQCAPPTDSRYDSLSQFRKNEYNGGSNDAATVMTDTEELPLPSNSKASSINTFAQALCDDLGPLHDGAYQYMTEPKWLPSMLKDFSINLRRNATQKAEIQATSFIRQNRNYISRAVWETIEAMKQCKVDEQLSYEAQDADLPTANEKVNMWNADLADYEPLAMDVDLDEDSSIDSEDRILSGFAAHHQFLKDSKEYKWLLGQIRAKMTLSLEDSNILLMINRTISATFDDITDKRARELAPLFAASFKVSLDIQQFLDWYYESDTCRELDNVITVTGTSTDAQAITCREYMEQVWPVSGHDTLRVIEKCATIGLSGKYECKLPNNTRFSCVSIDGAILVSVIGTQPTLIEIGEQLSWLCAALRNSPDLERMARSTAQISVLENSMTVLEDAQLPTANFAIDAVVEPFGPRDPGPEAEGCCWHLLFQNPVIVQGFPIPLRNHSQKGLEISIELMAGLGVAEYLTDFNNVPVLKGFSTMFVASQWLQDDSLQWHFQYKANGDRISYMDMAIPSTPEKEMENGPLEPLLAAQPTRNFVGWASSARRLAGTVNVDYNRIDGSKASFCSAGCALQKLSLNGGKFITVGVTIGSGIRNRRLSYLGNRSYGEAVNYSHQNMYVNMYDVEDRRAWLIDGASAALHISRAQLSHPKSPYTGNADLDLTSFKYASPEGAADAAVRALKDKFNMMLQVDIGPPEVTIEETVSGVDGKEEKKVEKKSKVKVVLFHEIVKRNLDLLELMHDYQNLLMEADGFNLRFTDRDKFEGWDILDVIKGVKSLKPRMQYLKSSGRGWMDLSREIFTVNFLGRRLGQLIKPASDAAYLCQKWKQVPKGKDYLTVCVSTVDEICGTYGEGEIDRFRPTKDIYWHQAGLLFEKCECSPGKSVCDRIQVLLPRISTHKKTSNSSAGANGAVIFGRSTRFPWRFPKTGDPTPKTDKQDDTDSDSSDDAQSPEQETTLDSGLGTSISASLAGGGETPQEVSQGIDKLHNVELGESSAGHHPVVGLEKPSHGPLHLLKRIKRKFRNK